MKWVEFEDFSLCTTSKIQNVKETILNNLQPILIFGIIILATFLAVFLINRFFSRLIKRSSETKSDPTKYQFLKHFLGGVIYLVGFGIAISNIPSLKAVATSILAGAGILAVAIGFASQQAMSNIISGFFIVLFKPFKINDRLTIKNSYSGIVEDITLRHTVLRNFENRRIIIPNSIISDEIIVNSDFVEDKICKWVDINISFKSDIDQAKRIMEEEVMHHPLHIDPRTPQQIEDGEPEVTVRVISLGEYAINLRAWAWTKDSADSFVLGCDLLESIKKRFDKEGINIPFPHRTIIHKNT